METTPTSNEQFIVQVREREGAADAWVQSVDDSHATELSSCTHTCMHTCTVTTFITSLK